MLAQCSVSEPYPYPFLCRSLWNCSCFMAVLNFWRNDGTQTEAYIKTNSEIYVWPYVVSNLAFCDVLVGVMSPLFSAVTPCSPSEVGGNPSTDDYSKHPCWLWIYHPAPGS